MSRGNITRRGKSSWRIKIPLGKDARGNRKTVWVTVRGTRADAERERTKLLAAADGGTLVEPSKTTVAEYIRAWLDGTHDLSPKTLERYRELAERQIIPTLGSIVLQKLRPSAIQEWHGTILKAGGKGGKPLTARTVGHAHRVLHRALERAVETETLSRNVASAISPPKVAEMEVEILDAEHVAVVLHKLDGHELYPIAAVALATGMRRGEILGLQLGDIDLESASLRVERSLEETAQGLRFKPPKTKHGRRVISLPPLAVTVLRDQRRRQLENRMALGLGRPAGDALVFSSLDGSPLSPRKLSRDWLRTCVARGLPVVRFHALRHTHASALISHGLDVVAISRRLGHANPTVTLNVYAHLFQKTDAAAAIAIEAVLRTGKER
jgi:integrase